MSKTIEPFDGPYARALDGQTAMTLPLEQLVSIPAGQTPMEGLLSLPDAAIGLVLFAHGSGNNRHSTRNNYVAGVLHAHRVGTLLLDLITPEENQDCRTCFDIGLLAQRLDAATGWLRQQALTQAMPMGYFGTRTGATAALMVAAGQEHCVQAVVSRGGRPDLAGADRLAHVRCPTLLLVGSRDNDVLELNRQAASHMRCACSVSVVRGATHLFQESGALDAVARQTVTWFEKYLKAAGPS